MDFPVLGKELRVSLRRGQSFILAFLFYSVLASVIAIMWLVLRETPGFRAEASRIIFTGILAVGCLGLSFHGAFWAAASLVTERERGSFDLLRTSPISAWKVVLQKTLSPLLAEWLLFFGTLPAFSLVFMLGGVGPREYVYQLLNLIVWLNTALLLGIWMSAGAKTSIRARGGTIGVILLVGAILPLAALVANILRIEGDVMGTAVVPASLAYRIWAQAFLVLCYALIPFLLLCPVWMYFSWYISDMYVGISGPPPFEFFPVYSPCPAVVSWGLHLGLQVILFALAVRAWKRTRYEPGLSQTWKESQGVRGAFRWALKGRVVRGHFGRGWRVFSQLEDRQIFKKGTWGKGVFAFSVFLLLGFFFAWIYRYSPRDVMIGSSLILPCSCFIGFLTILGFGPASIRRERDKRTGLFLLAAPISRRSILFGKWAHLQTLVFSVLAAGLLYGVAWYGAVRWVHPGARYSDVPEFLFYTFTFSVVWIPLLSLAAIVKGLKRKSRFGFLRVFLAVAVLWGITGSLSLLDNFDWNSPVLYRWAELFQFFLSVALPFALFVGAVLATVFLGNLCPGGEPKDPRFRVLWGGVWAAFLFLDGFLSWAASAWEGTLFVFLWDAFSIGELRIMFRCWAIPLCLAWLLWAWYARKSESWWAERLEAPTGES